MPIYHDERGLGESVVNDSCSYWNRDDATDRNKYLADNTVNPEQLIIQAEDEAEHQDMLDKLRKAMDCLMPQQKELFKKVCLEKRTNTEIAAEEGVTEAAIRGRLKKLQQRLRKLLS
ncbi:MAG: sigma-70 family RNA polymerase sigma factor [Bacillota bacterium]